jgi:hypothetical protein
MLRPAVLTLVLVYLINGSWMNSIEMAIHPLRCGSPVVLRCWGLRKVRCSAEGLVLHGVWQLLESATEVCLCFSEQEAWMFSSRRKVMKSLCMGTGHNPPQSVKLS